MNQKQENANIVSKSDSAIAKNQEQENKKPVSQNNSIANAKEEDKIVLDINDPVLYAKNIRDDETYYLWRTRNPRYFRSVESISKEYLCSTIWNFHDDNDDNKPSIVLAFYLDDEFRIGTVQSGIELKGKYKLTENNSVELYDYAYDVEDSLTSKIMSSFFSGNEWTMKFETNKNYFWYSDHLYGNDQKQFFGAEGSIPKDGKACTLNGQEILKETWEAVSNGRIKFRTRPDSNAKTIQIGFTYEYDLLDGTRLDYLLKGAKFTVLGRTKEKSTVGGKENYWYYISYLDFESPTYGWVFGEGIEEYKEDKAEDYIKIYEQEIKSLK
jgi:hypothetical protein